MTRFLLLFVLAVLTFPALAQEEPSLVTPIAEDTSVYTWVDHMPVFDKCDPMEANAYTCSIKELTMFLFSNIRYPQELMARNEGGITQVGIVIDKKGRIKKATIEASSGYKALDQEALRVVRSMPVWKPGIEGSQAVNVAMSIPVNFKPELYRRE
ncbi:MAG: energy transducer TonB [Saprospiraceae bacterium]|nr:energy transducer TonB [Saprospiraceae bacterium]